MQPAPDPERAVEAARAALRQALGDASAVDLSWIDPPPTSDGWALAPDALRLLWRVVKALRPGHVLEFGSGVSTRLLARACGAAGLACDISSIDHDPDYGAPAPADLAPLPPGVSVRCQLAPVVARDCGGKLLPVYRLGAGALASPRPPDLAVIDGPPVTLGGREGVLHQVMDVARPGTLVLLDDAGRAAERAAIAHWQDNLGDAVEVAALPGFAKGLAAIIVREPVRTEALWERKISATRDQIEALVPPCAAFVAVDPDHFTGGFRGGRRARPLVERDGVAWGLPAGDADAVAALERQREAGATHFVLVWPAFWWEESYPGLFRELHRRFRPALSNDRVRVFDLRAAAGREDRP
jgi:predicted O-methyltransferase YrrM